MSVNWFYVKENEKVGPIKEDQLIQLIKKKALTEDSYVWRKGLENWKKICEMAELKSNLTSINRVADKLPEQETTSLENKKTFSWDKVSHSDKIFSVKQAEQGTVFGPYSLEMLAQLYKEKRINSKSYIFAMGMEHWEILADLSIFEKVFCELPPKVEEEERRGTKRRPFVARLFFHNNDSLYEGICRDISLGGMQVLVSGFPGLKGEEISINVHPENSEHHFVASGKIGRILEGDQGVFIRFINLSSKSQNSILNYIETNDAD